MNALVKFNDQLPDFLRDPALFAANDAAAGGISGGRLPSLSIRGSRFHLVDEAGTDQMVNALTLDVVFLWANPVVSKTYYRDKYDPQAEPSGPLCYSDNGIAPSTNAQEPQHPRCAGCEWGAWGSATSGSGKAIKACSDSKKAALVLAHPIQTVTDNLMGTLPAGEQAYLLRVPATSMRAFSDVVTEIKRRGSPLVGVVMRLGFDPKVSHPQLTFTPTAMITKEFYLKIKPLLDDADTLKTLVGENDSPVGERPVSADAAAAFAKELAAAASPALAALVQPTAPPPQAAPATNGAAHPPEHVPPVRPRGRPAKSQATVQAAVDAGLVAQAPAPTPVPPAPQPTPPQPTPPPPQPTPQAASTVVPQASVAATSASVDALLDGLFGPK